MHRQFLAFRGIAIILVVLNHTIHMGNEYYHAAGFPALPAWASFGLTALSALGVFAVPIFLFLSGCFFAYATSNKDLKSSYKIVLKNLPNVVTPYLIWSIIFYIEIHFLHEQRFSLSGWAKNLIVGYPFNFVPLLIFFYILAPLLVKIGKRFGWLLIILIGLYQLFLIGVVRPEVLGLDFPAWLNILAPPVLYNPLADWAIYFPLGLVYVLNMKATLPLLQRGKWALLLSTIGFYILGVLNSASILHLPIARYIAPIPFMLITPIVSHRSIPNVRFLELFGRRAYGLYLMNLLVLDLTLFSIQKLVTPFLANLLILLPILFVITLMIPYGIMKGVEEPLNQSYIAAPLANI